MNLPFVLYCRERERERSTSLSCHVHGRTDV